MSARSAATKQASSNRSCPSPSRSQTRSASPSPSWQASRHTGSSWAARGGRPGRPSRSGEEKIASQQVEIKQEGDLLQVATITRGLSEDEGGYHWSGELRLWDNEVLMGWYAANDGSIRSKGTMYFVLHPHGLNMSGRWVGLGFDGRIMSGWASMGQTREESEKTMASLISSEGVAYVND